MVTIKLLKRTFKEWQDDKASRLAAALAFFTVLSILPLLVLIVTIVSQFASSEAARQAIVQQVEQIVRSSEGANAIEMILEAASQPTSLSLAALTSVVVLLVRLSF